MSTPFIIVLDGATQRAIWYDSSESAEKGRKQLSAYTLLKT
jgi:hypothetical protein